MKFYGIYKIQIPCLYCFGETGHIVHSSRLQLIILALDHSRKEYQAEDVIRHFLRKEQSDEFTIFADKLIRQKNEEGHLSLAVKYQTSLNSLCRFLNGRLLTFDGIDSSLMLSYNTTC